MPDYSNSKHDGLGILGTIKNAITSMTVEDWASFLPGAGMSEARNAIDAARRQATSRIQAEGGVPSHDTVMHSPEVQHVLPLLAISMMPFGGGLGKFTKRGSGVASNILRTSMSLRHPVGQGLAGGAVGGLLSLSAGDPPGNVAASTVLGAGAGLTAGKLSRELKLLRKLKRTPKPPAGPVDPVGTTTMPPGGFAPEMQQAPLSREELYDAATKRMYARFAKERMIKHNVAQFHMRNRLKKSRVAGAAARERDRIAQLSNETRYSVMANRLAKEKAVSFLKGSVPSPTDTARLKMAQKLFKGAPVTDQMINMSFAERNATGKIIGKGWASQPKSAMSAHALVNEFERMVKENPGLLALIKAEPASAAKVLAGHLKVKPKVIGRVVEGWLASRGGTP